MKKKCIISWCTYPCDSVDGWCWGHLVSAYVNHIPLPEKDRVRVQQAMVENG